MGANGRISRGAVVRLAAAAVAVAGWAVVAWMMLVPLIGSAGGTMLEPERFVCPLPASEAYAPRYTEPGGDAVRDSCVRRRERGPAVAVTALVVAAPAAVVWLYPRRDRAGAPGRPGPSAR